MDKKPIHIIPLICKTCGQKLSGDDNDVLFFCTFCNTGWEVVGDELVERKVYRAQPSTSLSGFDNIIWLPFWVFEIEDIIIDAKDDKLREVFMDKSSKIKHVYVEAYDSFMGSLYGNLALQYLGNSIDYELTRAERVVGCTRPADELIPHIKYYILKYLDKLRDVTEIDLEVEQGDIYLVLFPYALVEEHQLLDLMLNIKILSQGIMNFPTFVREYIR